MKRILVTTAGTGYLDKNAQKETNASSDMTKTKKDQTHKCGINFHPNKKKTTKAKQPAIKRATQSMVAATMVAASKIARTETSNPATAKP